MYCGEVVVNKLEGTMSEQTWLHGKNDHHEYYEQGRYCVARNFGEESWTIYEHRKRSTRMVPNPFPAKHEARFVEVTDIPHHGEKFGDRPHHDTIPNTLTPNYAWDSSQQAQTYVEQDLPT